MDSKYFKNPGDLSSESKHFKPAGDLVDVERGTVSQEKYFRRAGNLEDDKVIIVSKNDKCVEDKSFKVAEDLTDKTVNSNVSSLEEINDYLLMVVSGKKYPSVCELGVLMGSGRMIVTLEELKNLVETGHNIVFANVINAERSMIEVEFQKYVYNEELMEKRRRF